MFLVNTQPALAKSKSATIISTKTLSKAPYRAVSGYLYSTAHLTTKKHNADHYPLTTFYATHAATVKKANGNKAVYYYVKNGNGKVRGWIWQGHLVRIINVQKQRQQINNLVNQIDQLSSDTHSKVTSLLSSIKKADVLGTMLKDFKTLSGKVSQNSDLQKLAKIYQILKSDGETLAAIFQNGVNKLYTGVVALHNFNSHVFALARGILSLLPNFSTSNLSL